MARAPPSISTPTKRTRKKSSISGSIQHLERILSAALSQKASLNPLTDLLEIALNVDKAKDVSKAIYALYRVFVVIVSNGGLEIGVDENSKVVQGWMRDQLNEYVEFLGSLLTDSEKSLRMSALQILFSLLKHLSTSTSQHNAHPQFHALHFRCIVSSLLLCPPSRRCSPAATTNNTSKIRQDVRDLFVNQWFSVYDDVRWFFLRESASIISNTSSREHPHLPHNLLSILERLDTFPTKSFELNAWWVEEIGVKPPGSRSRPTASESSDDGEANENEDDDWRKFFEDETLTKNTKKRGKTTSTRLSNLSIHQSLHSLASHRAVFTRTWLTLLPTLSHSVETTKALSVRALSVMHRGVLPNLTRPILVMDWVVNCVDHGDSVGLLALNALFLMMKDYNLDYPAFYTRLYAFLDRNVMHLKHRARFFRMAELFLSSTHLPATLLASFIKRLSRLSLTAPPAAIIMTIPFVYNLLKRHPSLMVMIHRDQLDQVDDPFIADEADPNITRAQDSSLWELYSHKNHYHSAVSTLSRIFEESFTKPGYAMEDFFDHTYGTMFQNEAKRKLTREPVTAMDLKSNLFPSGVTTEHETPPQDAIGELWLF